MLLVVFRVSVLSDGKTKPCGLMRDLLYKDDKSELSNLSNYASFNVNRGYIRTNDGDGNIIIQHPEKHPKRCSYRVPRLDDKAGETMLDKEKKPVFEEEYRVYTCYMHAHLKQFKKRSLEANKELMQDISKKARRSH